MVSLPCSGVNSSNHSVNLLTVRFCFFPDSHSADGCHRKTPLGTPLLTPAGRCYSPLSLFTTPPPIREEEPITAAAAGSCDSGKVLPCVRFSIMIWAKITDFLWNLWFFFLWTLVWFSFSNIQQSDKPSCSSLEGNGHGTPPSSQQTNHIQPAPPFFTPEPSLRRANGFQAPLSCESPQHGAAPTTAASQAGLWPLGHVNFGYWSLWLMLLLYLSRTSRGSCSDLSLMILVPDLLVLRPQLLFCPRPSPPLWPRTLLRWWVREVRLLSLHFRSTSSRTWSMKPWRTSGLVLTTDSHHSVVVSTLRLIFFVSIFSETPGTETSSTSRWRWFDSSTSSWY